MLQTIFLHLKRDLHLYKSSLANANLIYAYNLMYTSTYLTLHMWLCMASFYLHRLLTSDLTEIVWPLTLKSVTSYLTESVLTSYLTESVLTSNLTEYILWPLISPSVQFHLWPCSVFCPLTSRVFCYLWFHRECALLWLLTSLSVYFDLWPHQMCAVTSLCLMKYNLPICVLTLQCILTFPKFIP